MTGLKMNANLIVNGATVRRVAVIATGVLLASCTLSDNEARLKTTHANSTNATWDELFEAGKSQFNKGHYGLALEKFRSALAKKPGSVAVLNAVGATYDKLDRYELSQRYYARALGIKPNSTQTLNNIGYSLMLQEKYGQALSYLTKAADSKADDAYVKVAKRNYKVAYYKSMMAAADGGSETIQPASLGDSRAPASASPSVTCPAASVWLEKTGDRVYTLVTAPSRDSLATMRSLTGGTHTVTGNTDCGQLVRETFRTVPRISKSSADAEYRAPVSVEEPHRQQVAVSDEAELKPIKVSLIPVESSPLVPAKVTTPVVQRRPGVEVSNGAGRTELASRVRSYLTSKGTPISRITNADSFDNAKTMILYREGHLDQARALAEKLPIPVTLKSEPTQASDIRVRLGHDILKFDTETLKATKISQDALKESWT